MPRLARPPPGWWLRIQAQVGQIFSITGRSRMAAMILSSPLPQRAVEPDQALHELQRAHDPVAPRCLELELHLPCIVELHASVRKRRPGGVAAQLFQPLAVARLDPHCLAGDEPGLRAGVHGMQRARWEAFTVSHSPCPFIAYRSVSWAHEGDRLPGASDWVERHGGAFSRSLLPISPSARRRSHPTHSAPCLGCRLPQVPSVNYPELSASGCRTEK